MRNLNKRTLALLSLLTIVGGVSIHFTHDNLLFMSISYLLCFIGGYAIGTLIFENDKEK